MEIVYNPEIQGFQILFTKRNGINPDLWHKPVNERVYQTWGDAMHDLDKWAEQEAQK